MDWWVGRSFGRRECCVNPEADKGPGYGGSCGCGINPLTPPSHARFCPCVRDSEEKQLTILSSKCLQFGCGRQNNLKNCKNMTSMTG